MASHLFLKNLGKETEIGHWLRSVYVNLIEFGALQKRREMGTLEV